MDIILRNFFRLIRSGSFSQNETIEPMSVFKWGKVYQLALIHQVVEPVYQGMLRSKNQFFFHITDQQWALWEKTVKDYQKKDWTEENEFLSGDRLTNPILNYKLQNILDDEHTDLSTRQLLLMVIRIARYILNEGLPINQLVDLGLFLQKNSDRVDFRMLQKWFQSLKLEQISMLEGTLLIHLFGFEAEEILFLQGKTDKNVEKVAEELTKFTKSPMQDFYFSQDPNSIFVHTSNGAAIMGHVRRSARYFGYYPSETVTNFFASFANSLSHIEE